MEMSEQNENNIKQEKEEEDNNNNKQEENNDFDEEEENITEKEEVKHIEFGITKGNSFSFGTATANAVFRINTREEIITTSREIIRVDSGVIVNRAPHKSCTGVYCPIYDALVTITTVRSAFSVFLLNVDIREPVVSGITLDQIGICHVLFDERNSTIVTFGNGIKTWYLDCLPKSSRHVLSDNYANIRPRASFAQFHTSFAMIIPCLDTFNHRVFVPTQDGLLCYDYDGNFLPSPLQHNNHWFTMFSFNPYNKKMITSDRDEAKECKAARAAQFKKQIVTQGVQYWRQDGSLSKELTFTNASLFAAFFIDKEFAITVDSSFYIHIIDMKTMKFFTCCQIECRPNHIFFQNDEKNLNLVICSASNVYYYNICIPWRLWLLTHIPPTMIQRCPRFESAARIAVEFIDSSVRLFTPYSILLTLCHSASPASPTSVVIDRGTSEIRDRDQVYVVLENGVVQKFSANECPCLPASTMNLKAHCCCIAEVFDQKCFLFGTKVGDILMYDYENLKFIRRIICCEGEILFLFHHIESNSLLALTDYKMFRISTITGKVTSNYYQKCHKCAALFEDLLIVGYENGSYLIQRIHNDNDLIIPLHKSKHPLHPGRVVGLSKGSNYFVSAGFDGTILVWDMHAIVLAKISFPSPVYSVGVHNGFRGLLVGTDTEIMFIDGKLIFGGYIDPEDIQYDNYDKKRDYLLGTHKSLFDDEDEEEDDNEFDADGKRKRNRKRKGKNKNNSGDSIDADASGSSSKSNKGRGRKSQYAAMMERMKKQKEKEEAEKLEKEKQQQQLQEEEEQANENQNQEEEEDLAKQEEEEENGLENSNKPKRKRKIRRKNDNGEYDEQYEYVDEKGNPIQDDSNSKDNNKKKKVNDEDEDYTEVKQGVKILAGKEKVVVENLLEPKTVPIDEELKKRIYAEEDEKEEKAKKKKKEKEEKEKKEKEEKEKKKKTDSNKADSSSSKVNKKGKKKGKVKKGENGEEIIENDGDDDGGDDNEDDSEDEDETESENGDENGTKTKKSASKKDPNNNENDPDASEDEKNEKGENNDDTENKKSKSTDKKSPKKPSRPSAEEAHKQNPRNNKIRQNYNDPNANPKFNANLTNQVIDGENLDGNDDAAADGEEEGRSSRKDGSPQKSEKQKGGGKGKGKSGNKKGKKGKSNATASSPSAANKGGASRAGLDERGNRIKDPKADSSDTSNFGGGAGGYNGGSGTYQNRKSGDDGPIGFQNGQGGKGGYKGGTGGYNGGQGGFNNGQGGNGNYQGGPGGNGGYQNGPGGYQGGPGGNGGYSNGPGGYQSGPNGYQGGPGNNGYQSGPGGYQSGPGGNGNYSNGPGGYQGGPNGYQNGPGGYQGGPGGNGVYSNGPGGYQGDPGGSNGYQNGPGGFQNGQGGYNGSPNGYQGGPGNYQGGQGGNNGFQNGPGGFNGGPGGYQNGPSGYQGGPGGYNGEPGESGYYGNGQGGSQSSYQSGPGGNGGYNSYQNGPSNDPAGNRNSKRFSRTTNIGTSPIDFTSPNGRHRTGAKVKNDDGGYDYEYSSGPSSESHGYGQYRRPNSSSSSEYPESSSMRQKRLRIAELQRNRCKTPSGTQLYNLNHIVHVHLRVNRDFPPDVDIRKSLNPPCLVYSPEYLSLALGDPENDTSEGGESRWEKFKRMCFFAGVNDFAHESFRRTQKHFLLTNSSKVQDKPQNMTVKGNGSLPVAQIFQTDNDPLNSIRDAKSQKVALRKSRRLDGEDDEDEESFDLRLPSNLPSLNLTDIDGFDFKADMIALRQSQAISARSNRTVQPPSTARRRLNSQRSIFPWLDDEMLRPASARRPKAQIRIINPTGGSKQAYRNLVSIFKKVKKK